MENVVASSLPVFAKGKGLTHYRSTAAPVGGEPNALGTKGAKLQGGGSATGARGEFFSTLAPAQQSARGVAFSPRFLASNPSFAPAPASLPPLSPESQAASQVASQAASVDEQSRLEESLPLSQQLLRAMQKYRVAAELQG